MEFILEELPSTYVEGFHDLAAVKAMEYRPLGKTGLKISKLSFGGGPLGSHFGPYDEEEAIRTVRNAIKRGINYIDTGYWYGQGKSEVTLGKALKGIPRQAYYIATKVGRYDLDYENMFDFSAERTRKNVKDCLERLRIEYVDVVQVHDIEFAPSLDIVLTQTLPELSRQVSEGRVKHIGLTGYPISTLKECIEKSNINISVVLTYCRYTILDDSLLEYIPFFQKHDIGIVCASAPCMGLLTNRGPFDWHPASDETKQICQQAAQCCIDRDVELGKLAMWHGLQCPDVSTYLVGMQNLRDLDINLRVLRDGLTDDEQKLLNELKEKFFKKINSKHWEGVELERYRNITKR